MSTKINSKNIDLTEKNLDAIGDFCYHQLRYPHVIQYLDSSLGVIHQIAVEEVAVLPENRIAWHGPRKAWIVLRKIQNDMAFTSEIQNPIVIDFLKNYAREKIRTVWLVLSPVLAIKISPSGSHSPTREIPQRGILILLSSIDPTSDSCQIEFD